MLFKRSGAFITSASSMASTSISAILSFFLNVLMYSIENFNTFSSLMASVITYLCKILPKSIEVVRLPNSFVPAFFSKIGVPVKPNI